MTTGIIVFAHGSRIEPANQAVRWAADELARSGACSMVQAAFLELGTPGLEEAADILAARGVDRIVVVPYFLTPGLHMERDLPPLVDNILKKHKDMEVLVAASLDRHPGLIQALADRARDVLLSPRHSNNT